MTLRAPTGNVERWLVSHRETKGVLSVVWDYYWFVARARAEGLHQIPRDLLAIEWLPLFEDEDKYRLSGVELAKRLGRTLHGELMVTAAGDAAGVVTAAPVWRQCPEWFVFKNGITSVRCTHEAGHQGEHVGWRARWRTNGRA